MKNSKIRLHWTSLISIGFFGFILWIIYQANVGETNVFFSLVRQVPFGDKLGHFFLFGLLTFLLNLVLKFKVFRHKYILLGTLLVLGFVSVEESSQYWIPSRTFDGIDFLADLIGIALFDFISKYYYIHYFSKNIKPNK